VGPRSAGARPGPACYGRGGTDPTVTDALVVLGYIDPKHFLGGEMRLDPEAARSACARLGSQLGTDAVKAAWGIWEIAKVEMIRALRAQFAQRGLDPREFAIISMGGCGGLFNALIAQELGVGRVLVPELTSVLSAFGAANADIRRERTRGIGVLLPSTGENLAGIAGELTQTVSEDLAADGIAAAHRHLSFEADLRFMRQQFELTIPCDPAFGAQAQRDLIDAFTNEYQRRYGSGALVLGAPVELVSLRAVGRGQTVRAELVRPPTNPDAPIRQQRTRQIWVGNGSQVEPLDVNVHSSIDLQPGTRIQGPALLDGADTTVWIPPRVNALVSGHRTIDMEVIA
jgi:N-methylhydantoinase A